jgi:isocitrate lyase
MVKQEHVQSNRKSSIGCKAMGHQDGKVTVPHEDFLAKINLFVMLFRIRS